MSGATVTAEHYHMALDRRDVREAELKSEIASLRAQRDKLAEALTWRPMETAPRDGTPVLVCAWYWWMPENGNNRWEHTRVVETSWQDDHFPVGELREPTHWTFPPPAPDVGDLRKAREVMK